MSDASEREELKSWVDAEVIADKNAVLSSRGAYVPSSNSTPRNYVDAASVNKSTSNTTSSTTSAEPVNSYVSVASPMDSAVLQPITIGEAPADDSESFFAARGTFYRVPLRRGSGPGLYAVEGLSQFISSARNARTEAIRRKKFDASYPNKFQLDTNADPWNATQQRIMAEVNADIDAEARRRADTDIAQNSDALAMSATPILITGIELLQSDIVGPMSCLNNVKLLYTFGQAFGNVSIRGEMLLGPLGNIQSDGVQILLNFFNQQRVSNLKKTTMFSIAQTGYEMYLTGLGIGEVEIQFHVLPFTMTGILLDPSNTQSELLNPANVVTDGEVVTIESVQNNSFEQALGTPAKAVEPEADRGSDTAVVMDVQQLLKTSQEVEKLDQDIAKLQKENTEQSQQMIQQKEEEKVQVINKLKVSPAGETTPAAQRLELQINKTFTPPPPFTVPNSGSVVNSPATNTVISQPVTTPTTAPDVEAERIKALLDDSELKILPPPAFETVKPVVRENKTTR